MYDWLYCSHTKHIHQINSYRDFIDSLLNFLLYHNWTVHPSDLTDEQWKAEEKLKRDRVQPHPDQFGILNSGLAQAPIYWDILLFKEKELRELWSHSVARLVLNSWQSSCLSFSLASVWDCRNESPCPVHLPLASSHSFFFLSLSASAKDGSQCLTHPGQSCLSAGILSPVSALCHSPTSCFILVTFYKQRKCLRSPHCMCLLTMVTTNQNSILASNSLQHFF